MKDEVSREKAYASSRRRWVRLFWAVYTIAMLGLSAWLCHTGSFTAWRLPDEPYAVWDPEACYMAKGIAFFYDPILNYAKNQNTHPGLPSLVLMQVSSRVTYWVGLLFGPAVSFY